MPPLSMRLLATAGAAALLPACGTGYLMESEVQSASRLAGMPAQPTFTFERLPSAAPRQDAVEAAAGAALQRAGLRRDDAAPRYRVQVGAQAQHGVSPWAEGWNPAFGGTRSISAGWPSVRRDYNWVYSEVRVLVRDAASQEVVYETRARSDGPWLNRPQALEGLFAAALQGFPNPPAGPRTVHVQLGSQGPQTVAPAGPAPGSLWPSFPAS